MAQFNTLYEEFETNFKARASPRSRNFKLKWTKENERGINIVGRYYIIIEIFEVDENEGNGLRRRKDLEPNWPYLWSDNYKWDVGIGLRSRPLDPDKIYTVRIHLRYSYEQMLSGQEFARYELTNCRCYISELQFQNLFLKAQKFCLEQCGGRPGMRQIEHFYRSDRIPNNVIMQEGRFRLRAKQRLATQGHRVPGIERISFFALNRDPPIGQRFVKYPIESLIDDPAYFNFYFMDILCHQNSPVHHILIAVAERNTREERYCTKRLGPPLDQSANPFLCVNNNGEYFVPGTIEGHLNCTVEIFFVVGEWQLTFEFNEVIISEPGGPFGRRGVPNENCVHCCHLTPPENFGQNAFQPRIQFPSFSFNESTSYPSTPEREEE